MGEYVVESSGENTRMQEDFDSWEKGKGCQLLSPTPATGTQHGEEHPRSCFTTNAERPKDFSLCVSLQSLTLRDRTG